MWASYLASAILKYAPYARIVAEQQLIQGANAATHVPLALAYSHASGVGSSSARDSDDDSGRKSGDAGPSSWPLLAVAVANRPEVALLDLTSSLS